MLVGRRTESFDNMDPVGVDDRWDAFAPFHDYIVQSFPLTYVHLSNFNNRPKYAFFIKARGSDAHKSQHIRFAV